VPSINKLRYEPGADRAACTGDENSHCVSSRYLSRTRESPCLSSSGERQ
jgi:hypothetical protein